MSILVDEVIALCLDRHFELVESESWGEFLVHLVVADKILHVELLEQLGVDEEVWQKVKVLVEALDFSVNFLLDRIRCSLNQSDRLVLDSTVCKQYLGLNFEIVENRQFHFQVMVLVEDLIASKGVVDELELEHLIKK